jgi:cytochrome c2
MYIRLEILRMERDSNKGKKLGKEYSCQNCHQRSHAEGEKITWFMMS